MVSFKSNKGITAMSVVVTVIILAVILGITGYTVGNNLKLRELNNMYEDIKILEDKVEAYYLEHGSLPVSSSVYFAQDNRANPNDNNNFYIIDTLLLNNVSLNNSPDKGNYIVNEQSHTIYYLNGVTVGDVTYYTLPKEYGSVDLAKYNSYNRLTQTSDGIKVGDFVTYIPPTRSEYTSSSSVNGNTTQTISQEYTIWRVLNIYRDGNIDLVANVTTSNSSLSFRGAKGYNNFAFIMNDACNYLYSYAEKGITARSLNLDDIESHFNETANNSKDSITHNYVKGLTNNTDYIESINLSENSVTYKGANTYCPDIIKYQSIISKSDQFYNTPTSNSSFKETKLKVYHTLYSFSFYPTNFDDYDGTKSLFYNAVFGTNTYFGLASRFVSCSDSFATFYIAGISGADTLSAYSVYDSRSANGRSSIRLCPVVSLKPNVSIIKCSGTNSETNTHTLSY